LEEVIQEHPELLKQIAHAQLKAAAGKGPEGRTRLASSSLA
jgi:hypothetical protein